MKKLLIAAMAANIFFASCKKNDEAPKPNAVGYWKVTIGGPFNYMLNRQDGTGRCYFFQGTGLDTSTSTKMDGKWTLTGNEFAARFVNRTSATDSLALVFSGRLYAPSIEMFGSVGNPAADAALVFRMERLK